MSWAERSTGISPTITQFLFAPMLGRIASVDAYPDDYIGHGGYSGGNFG